MPTHPTLLIFNPQSDRGRSGQKASDLRSLVEKLATLPVKPALCVVGEPTSMQVIVGHKGGGMKKGK